MDFTEGHVTAQDGLSLYYRDYGPKWDGKTPVLCLPGLTRNCRDFHLIAKGLMHERRVICPDIRGRGLSDYDPDWRHYDFFNYISDIRAMLAALNLHRVFIVGTSMGGLLAMCMGAVMPGAMAGALINDVGPDIDDAGLDNIIAYVRKADQVWADWGAAAAFLKSCFPEMPGMTDDLWERAARRSCKQRDDGSVVSDWDPAIVKPIEQNHETVDLWPLFRSLRRMPLVGVRGGLSDVLSAATFLSMQDAIPSMNAVTVDGMGHAPTLSEPVCQEALNNVLADADRNAH